jgi:hypothetical protein
MDTSNTVREFSQPPGDLSADPEHITIRQDMCKYVLVCYDLKKNTAV